MATTVAATKAPASMAASQTSLSKDSLSNLKCGSCQCFLSVAPISMEKDGTYVCGRCNSSGTRVSIYEELAKYMVFPCRYEKCKVQVAWGQVDNHERNCPQRTMVCPFNTCKLVYALKSILQHFSAMHQEYIFINDTTIMRKMKDMPTKNFNPDRKFSLFLFKEIPYIVIVCLDHCTGENSDLIEGYQFAFGVFCVDTFSKKIVYDVDLETSTSNGVLNFKLENKEIKPFDQRLHCLKCLNGSCSLSGHTNNLTKKQKIWLSRIKVDNLGDMNAMYTIKIHDKHEMATQAVSNAAVPNQGGHLVPIIDTISKITCNCREIMSAPIYVCVSGHSLCMNCKRNMMYCPTCRQMITDTRNLALEEIANTLKTPCQNANKGCKYSGPVKSTKQHQMDCKYNFL